jgi:hypothetical protein
VIRQEQEIKGIQTRNEENQTIPICRWYDLIPKRLHKLYQNLLEIINSFGKVAQYEINIQELAAFLYICSHWERNQRNNPVYNSLKKIKYPGIHLIKVIKDSFNETINHWRGKSKKTSEDEKTSHVHNWQNQHC